MRAAYAHKATLRKKIYALYAGSDAAREGQKKLYARFFLGDFFSVENRSKKKGHWEIEVPPPSARGRKTIMIIITMIKSFNDKRSKH